MNKQKALNTIKDQRFLLLLIIIVLMVIVGIINPRFLTLGNITAILQQISVLGILTMAMAMLLIGGGIDLSMGYNMTLGGIVSGSIIMSGAHPLLGVLAGIAASTLCGLANGIIVAKSKAMPLVVTIGTGQVFFGISLLISGGAFINFQHKLNFLREKLLGFLPVMVIVMIIVVFLMFVLLNKTKFGRRVVAIGGNERNAFLSGITVTKHKIASYTIAGFIVGIAGVVFAARLNAITALAGSGYETDAMVAAVIGGVTFEGGRGTVSGAFLGALLTGIISNALDILGVDAYTKIVISGAIIVTAVVVSSTGKRRN
ncbi:MAG: ABC transporter permease [Clostridiaceae bacterium]|nr:ABC transporter permease [Clostridiaceae bacterium]